MANGIQLGPGVRILGSGRTTSKLSATSGPLFVLNSAVHHVDIRDIYLAAQSGHIIATNGNSFYQCVIDSTTMVQYSPSHSIFHLDGPGNYIDNLVSNVEMNRPSGATGPTWLMRGPGGTKNCNMWLRCRRNGANAKSYFFHIEETGGSSYAYDNTFLEITAEQCPGGIINALTVQGLTLMHVNGWDTALYTADLIRVGKSPTGPPSRTITIVSCGRRGGALAAGVYDINCIPFESGLCTLIGNERSGGGAGAINAPASSTIIGSTPGSGGTLRTMTLGVGNALPATAPAKVVSKIEVFDMNGVSLGFVPVYDAIV